jgi:tryptophan-rich sensory protein
MGIMNLKNWSRNHTYGLIVGIILPMLMVPVVMLILSWVQNYSMDRLWYEFKRSDNTMSKMVTLAVLANLGIFYILLNKEKYNFAMGIILGSVLYLPLIVYLIFF